MDCSWVQGTKSNSGWLEHGERGRVGVKEVTRTLHEGPCGPGKGSRFILSKMGSSWRVKSKGETCPYLCFKKIDLGS